MNRKKSKTCKMLEHFEVQDPDARVTYVVRIAEYEPATPATLDEPAFGCEIDYGAVYVKGDMRQTDLFPRGTANYSDELHRVHQLIISALRIDFES